MSKGHVSAVLFFSGLWGISEVLLGGALYHAKVPYASAVLTAIGMVILTFAGAYFPQKGTATLIVACAMLYKFLNAPFFPCHLLGIVLLGICCDVFFGIVPVRNRALSAVATAYVNNGLFALLMTYVFGYAYCVQGGLAGVLDHVAVGGSMAALAGAVLVPVSFRLAEKKPIFHFPLPIATRDRRSTIQLGFGQHFHRDDDPVGL